MEESKVKTVEENFTSFLIDHAVIDVSQEDMFRPLLSGFVEVFKSHITKLEARNKELEEQLPKWISVRDRLPDERQAVLVSLKSFVVTVAYRSIMKGIKVWQLFGDIQSMIDIEQDTVDFWMSLPKPKEISKQ